MAGAYTPKCNTRVGKYSECLHTYFWKHRATSFRLGTRHKAYKEQSVPEFKWEPQQTLTRSVKLLANAQSVLPLG